MFVRSWRLYLSLLLVLTVLPAGGLGSFSTGAVPVAAAAGVCTTPSFAPPIEFATGPIPLPASVVVADFNGDGHQDVAWTNFGSGVAGELDTVSVRLGNGDGTFRAETDYPVGNAPEALVAADFNGDGHLDLVVANIGSNTVSVLVGNGDGTFRPAVSFAAGRSPVSLAVGDFQADGRLDLVVAGDGSGTVSLLRGNGDGSFQAPQPIAVAGFASSVVVGDFNRDGRPDIAYNAGPSGLVSILLGNGDGTFRSSATYAFGDDLSEMAVGDLNGDGRADLVVTDGGALNVFHGSLWVLLGNGDGTFQTPVRYPSGDSAFGVALADFNGDGVLDAAVVNGGSASVSLFLGTRDGAFQPPLIVPVGDTSAHRPRWIAAADLNADGHVDLAVSTGSAVAGNIVLLVNTCGGSSVVGGSSLRLNGTTAYAEVPSSSDLNITGDWTVEAWFKDEDPAGFNHDFHQILMKGDRDATAEAPYYVLVGRNSILAGVRTGGQDYPIVWDLNYLGLDPKLWHHVAVTFRADLNVLNLWLDGNHIAYLTVPAHSPVGNTLPLEIGRNGPSTGKYWLGKLDDVRIWSVARRGDDITGSYRARFDGPQPGLVANWHFDEGSGTTAFDSSGNHHAATLGGGATFSPDVHP